MAVPNERRRLEKNYLSKAHERRRFDSTSRCRDLHARTHRLHIKRTREKEVSPFEGPSTRIIYTGEERRSCYRPRGANASRRHGVTASRRHGRRLHPPPPTRPPDHPTTRPPDHPTTRPPDHPTNRPTDRSTYRRTK
jgi:hypothetical protein